MSISKPSPVLLGLAFWLLCAAGVAEAGSFAVSPVRATLSGTRSTESLTVRNNGDEPAVIQIEIVAWSQHDGSDVFQRSSEILASPPIFTIAPKATQVIRVGLRRVPDPNRELTYRMFLQEIPPSPRPGFQGLQVALRLSIPIFVLPRSEIKPVLVWYARSGEPGQIRLQATNTGNAHVQIANFKLSRLGGDELNTQQVATYILPHQSREWIVKANALPGAELHVVAKTDGDDVQAEVVVKTP